MIPQFPEFKKLALSDKEEIESFTKQFPPYSDFNFVSMWSWDIKGDMRVAWLHGNLVVKFNDYLTGLPFYSFLGTNQVNDTAAELIEVSKVLGQQAYIGLIPEVTAKLLDTAEFVVTEEVDHFDYIYELDVVAKMEHELFARKRKSIQQFLENQSIHRVLDITTDEARDAIKKVDEVWLRNKLASNKSFINHNESKAFERFFSLPQDESVIATFLFDGVNPIGYAIYEKESSSFVVSHFAKFDVSYKGINDYFLQQDSEYFVKQGFKLMNLEQDLGLSGLRANKKSFSTGIFLKKYSVMLK